MTKFASVRHGGIRLADIVVDDAAAAFITQRLARIPHVQRKTTTGTRIQCTLRSFGNKIIIEFLSSVVENVDVFFLVDGYGHEQRKASRCLLKSLGARFAIMQTGSREEPFLERDNVA